MTPEEYRRAIVTEQQEQHEQRRLETGLTSEPSRYPICAERNAAALNPQAEEGAA